MHYLGLERARTVLLTEHTVAGYGKVILVLALQ